MDIGGRLTLNIAFPPMVTAGHYTLSFDLFQGDKSLNSEVKVELDIAPNPAAPFAFARKSLMGLLPATSLDLSAKVSEAPWTYHGTQLIISMGEGTMTFLDASFLDLNGNPVSPAANPWNKVSIFTSPADAVEFNQHTGWAWVTSVSLIACEYGFPNAPTCLTPGTYWLQLRYRYEANGTSQIVYFPVKMVIEP